MHTAGTDCYRNQNTDCCNTQLAQVLGGAWQCTLQEPANLVKPMHVLSGVLYLLSLTFGEVFKRPVQGRIVQAQQHMQACYVQVLTLHTLESGRQRYGNPNVQQVC